MTIYMMTERERSPLYSLIQEKRGKGKEEGFSYYFYLEMREEEKFVDSKRNAYYYPSL